MASLQEGSSITRAASEDVLPGVNQNEQRLCCIIHPYAKCTVCQEQFCSGHFTVGNHVSRIALYCPQYNCHLKWGRLNEMPYLMVRLWLYLYVVWYGQLSGVAFCLLVIRVRRVSVKYVHVTIIPLPHKATGFTIIPLAFHSSKDVPLRHVSNG